MALSSWTFEVKIFSTTLANQCLVGISERLNGNVCARFFFLQNGVIAEPVDLSSAVVHTANVSDSISLRSDVATREYCVARQ